MSSFLNNLINGQESFRQMAEAHGGISDNGLTIKVVGAGTNPNILEEVKAAKVSKVKRDEESAKKLLPLNRNSKSIEI